MSQIAAALARSKGKKVEPVPSEASVIPAIHTSTPPMPPPKAPPAAAKGKKIPVKVMAIAGGVVLVILLGIGGYFMFRSEPPPPPGKPVVKKAAPVVKAPEPAPAPAAAKPPEIIPEPAPAELVGLAPELQEKLRKLPISARRSGTEQRIVVGRQVYLPGDTVIEGAILDSVLADRVIFRDAENHKFERQF